MPRRFAASDLLFADLLAGDIGRAQVQWPKLWSDAESATAWTRWLIYGRLAAARAEIALTAEDAETAIEWAHRALEILRRTRRRKYEVRALRVLGQAQARLGRRAEALSSLTDAVAVADGLIGQPLRWDARAALAGAAEKLGEDDVADRAFREARELVESFAAGLAPERAARFLAALKLEELLTPIQ
jgi:tetratricopeptide (TPR) repeat protein